MKCRNLFVFVLCVAELISGSCRSVADNPAGVHGSGRHVRPRHMQKPPASFNDTISIKTSAAVFYYPDSLQIRKIGDTLDSSVYRGIMHSYFYQVRNAHIVLKKNWPGLKIFDARNIRYVLFYRQDGSRECIDLNKKNDIYGLLVFNTKKSPLEIDMTNMETQISFYLKE